MTGLPTAAEVALNALQYAVEEGCDLTLFGRHYVPAPDHDGSKP